MTVSFTADRKTLLAACERALRCASRDDKIPIIAHMLLVAEGNCVKATGTNLDAIATATAPASVQTAGRVCVPASLLVDTLKRAASADVSFSQKAEQVQISAGRGVFKVQTLPAYDFPELFKGSPARHKFTLSADFIARIANEVTFARSKDLSRYYLGGTSWRSDGKQAEFCSTDGHMLSLLEGIPLSSDPFHVIVPVLPAVQWSGDVSVEISDSFIRFKDAETELTSKLVDGTFPDYRRVIPAAGENSVTVDRQELLATAARLDLHSPNCILFTSESDKLLLWTRTSNGEAEDGVAAGAEGSLRIALSPKLVAAVGGSFEAETIELRSQDEGSPLRITSPNQPDRLCVIMPMRLMGAMAIAARDDQREAA